MSNMDSLKSALESKQEKEYDKEIGTVIAKNERPLLLPLHHKEGNDRPESGSGATEATED